MPLLSSIMANKSELKVYDYNGVIVGVDGFRQWFKENHPEVWHQYKVVGSNNPEVLRAVMPQVQGIYEQATINDLYLVSLLPSVQERLERDAAQGYARTLFTSVPREVTERQLERLGIAGSIDALVTLSDIQMVCGLGNAVKEDPAVFYGLVEYCARQGIGTVTSYTDDTEKRVLSAVNAHRQLQTDGRQGIDRIYHFDEKMPEDKVICNGYEKIRSLLSVE